MLFFRHILIYFSVALICSFQTDRVAAQPYHPCPDMVVETEIYEAENRSVVKKIKYKIQTIKTETDNYHLDFLSFPLNSQPVCRIIFSADGTLSWQKSLIEKPRIVSFPLFIQPGFPVPVDILPVNQTEENKIYSTKNSSGGRTFLKTFTVTIQEIDLKTALEKGWIRLSQDSETLLHLFTVTDHRGNTISQQLWPDKDCWWLYEKTPFRHSWRIQ